MSTSWSPTTKRLVVVGLIVVGGFVVYLARGILAPVVIGALLTLVLSPLIEVLHRRLRLPRALAVAVTYLLLLGVLVAIPIVLVPALVRSAAALDLTEIATSFSEWIVGTLSSFRTIVFLGATIDLSSSIDPIIEAIESGGGGFDFDLGSLFSGAWSVTGAVFTGIIGFITSSLMALIISIYLALGAHGARQSAYSLVPEPYQPEMQILGARMSRVWTDYLRGQLTVAFIVGVISVIAMFILGLPGALIIGIIGGFFNIVPTFGPIFAGAVAGTVALFQGSTRFSVSNLVFAMIVVGVYILIQQLESSVITPRVMSETMAVSPLAVLVGILVGFSAAGVLGAIVAVPVVASGREVLRYVLARLADLEPYPDGPPPPRRTMADRLEHMRAGRGGPSDEPGPEAVADDVDVTTPVTGHSASDE
ncbi:MAG: AI-2E family transporter [Acidimicrobiia bacterium]|jgi:predicted PurR-regulated permease PerM